MRLAAVWALGASPVCWAVGLGEPKEVQVSDPALQAVHIVLQGVPTTGGGGLAARLGSAFEYRERGLEPPALLRDASARIVLASSEQYVVEVAWRRPADPRKVPLLVVLRTEGAVDARVWQIDTGPAPLAETAVKPSPSVGEVLAMLPARVQDSAQGQSPATAQGEANGEVPQEKPLKAAVEATAASDPTPAVASVAQQAPAVVAVVPAPPPVSEQGAAGPRLAFPVLESPLRPVVQEALPDEERPTEGARAHSRQSVLKRGEVNRSPRLEKPVRSDAARRPTDRLRLTNGSEAAQARVQMGAALGELQGRLKDLETIVGLMNRMAALQDRQLESLRAQINQARALQQAGVRNDAAAGPATIVSEEEPAPQPGLLAHMALGVGLALIAVIVYVWMRQRAVPVKE